MSSIIRSIERNIVKSEMKTNNIQEAWYRLQVAKYGPERYCAIRNRNRKIVKSGNGRQHKVGYKFIFSNKGIEQVLN